MTGTSKLLPIFLVLVLLLATGTILGEGRMCESPSQRFRGICVSKRNCAAACQTEGHPAGECQGFRRRCMCSRPCAVEQP